MWMEENNTISLPLYIYSHSAFTPTPSIYHHKHTHFIINCALAAPNFPFLPALSMVGSVVIEAPLWRQTMVSTALLCGTSIHLSLVNPILPLTRVNWCLWLMQTSFHPGQTKIRWKGKALSDSEKKKSVSNCPGLSKNGKQLPPLVWFPSVNILLSLQCNRWKCEVRSHTVFSQEDGHTPGCWWNHWWIPLRTGNRCPQCEGSWTSYLTWSTHTNTCSRRQNLKSSLVKMSHAVFCILEMSQLQKEPTAILYDLYEAQHTQILL